MDLTAKLTRLQTKHYTNPHCTHNDATILFEQADDGTCVSNTFETCLRIKNTIDAAEASMHRVPGWPQLALLTNLEAHLWRLTAGTPLRQNPFLTHWVEALQRLDNGSAKPKQNAVTTGIVAEEEICEARAEWIKQLLLGKDLDALFNTTPCAFQNAFATRGVKTSIDLQVYVSMLEEENIYDKDPDTLAQRKEDQRPKEEKIKNGYEQRKADILEKLEHEPHAAVQDLTHLPVDLPYLDFLTTLLTARTLERYAIDPAPVVISYIQHALRTVEHMGAPPPPNTASTSSSNTMVNGIEGSDTTNDADREYGSGAQSRAIKLLLLFITALIRKELVGVEVLYFEIQEICVRYVWMKSVREFRGWVEEGEGEAGEGMSMGEAGLWPDV